LPMHGFSCLSESKRSTVRPVRCYCRWSYRCPRPSCGTVEPIRSRRQRAHWRIQALLN